jgi:hypothetical protein
MPVDVCMTVMWLSLALADEVKTPAPVVPDAELLEFLGSFETKTGQWPELNDVLAKKARAQNPPAPMKEEVKR